MKARSNSRRIMFDIQTMTNAELTEAYDITIDEDGNVWDTLECKEFDNLRQWANYTTELEEDERAPFLKFSGKYGYDDD